MASGDDTEHYPWCVEHDPTGTCLGDVRQLPGGGAAWIEGNGTSKIVIFLPQPGRGHLSELQLADAQHLVAVLEDLAGQLHRYDA